MADKDLTVEQIDHIETKLWRGEALDPLGRDFHVLCGMGRRAVTEIPALETALERADHGNRQLAKLRKADRGVVESLSEQLAAATAQVELIEEMQIRIGKDADHIVILEAQMERMRDALVRIRGWREIDRNTLRERLTAIEEICDEALSDLPSTNLEKSDA